MVGLNWDDTLATVAQDYANRCNYTHNDFRYNNYTALGGTMSSVGTSQPRHVPGFGRQIGAEAFLVISSLFSDLIGSFFYFR